MSSSLCYLVTGPWSLVTLKHKRPIIEDSPQLSSASIAYCLLPIAYLFTYIARLFNAAQERSNVPQVLVY